MVVTLANPSGDNRTYVLTFAGTPIVGGSLADGVYDLTVAAAKVHDAAGGPASTLSAKAALAFRRLYSDEDGNGISDNADLFQFRSTYTKPSTDPAYNPFCDYDGNGVVDAADIYQIRSRRSIVFQGF
jgi:hypothetical protein